MNVIGKSKSTIGASTKTLDGPIVLHKHCLIGELNGNKFNKNCITIIDEMDSNNTISFVILKVIIKLKLNKCHVSMVY